MNSKRIKWMGASLALCLTLSLGACGGGGGTDVGGGGGGAAQGDLTISAVEPTHGQADMVVTLTGSGFSTALSENLITLNNKPCTVTAATATELKVTIPANAGSGNLRVTVLAKSAQSPTFTYDLTFATVSTLAGAQVGSLDGVGAAAQFNAPSGMALNAGGFLFVGDTGNHRIRVVNAAGSVGTFAGNTAGFADGTGLLALFNAPDAMAFDSFGNLFVADPGNNIISPGSNTIRKVTPAALVTTFVRDTAGLSGPSDLAFDSAGSLFVADRDNHRIVKIDSGGALTTFAGGTVGSADGTGSAAQFHFPTGLAFCGDGNLFVADKDNNKIRKITPGGVVTTYAGGVGGLAFADGSLTEARFLFPRQLACDSEGKLFVVDTGNERIRMITPSGEVSTLAGSTAPGFADGDGATARFSLPQHIVIAADGSLLVSDAANERIRRIVWR